MKGAPLVPVPVALIFWELGSYIVTSTALLELVLLCTVTLTLEN